MSELRSRGDCIAGDTIKIECRKPGKCGLYLLMPITALTFSLFCRS